MITQRAKVFSVTHPETGLSVQVYRVDCFVEVVVTEGLNHYQFLERFYETETKQRVLPYSKPKIWIVQTGVGNFYVKERE